jgi:hypothetical protein
MNNPLTNNVISTALLCFSMSALAADVDVVGSREYKILLDTSAFSGNAATRSSKVNSYWSILKNLIENESIERNTSGNLSLEKNRTVIFTM